MNKIKNIKCPACGAIDFKLIKEEKSIQAPYGPELTETEITYTCNICDSEFDYNDIIGKKKESSLEISKKKSINEMLSHLSKIGYSMAAIERALELPQRTISRWKANKELSSIGIALLRIIRTYPWILEVAEKKFDFNDAWIIYIQNAVNDFISLASYGGFYFSEHFGNQINIESLSIYSNFQKNINVIQRSPLDTKTQPVNIIHYGGGK